MLEGVAPLTDYPVARSSYPFTGIICDLGGGEGSLLRTILQFHPTVQGISFERPVVIQHLQQTGTSYPFELVAGDFFQTIPYADIYTLKSVFHNWPDADCAAILQKCFQTNPHARVLVIEQLMENPRGFAPLLNLLMMTEQNGQERTLAEYKNIGLRAQAILMNSYPTIATHTIMEFVREG